MAVAIFVSIISSDAPPVRRSALVEKAPARTDENDAGTIGVVTVPEALHAKPDAAVTRADLQRPTWPKSIVKSDQPATPRVETSPKLPLVYPRTPAHVARAREFEARGYTDILENYDFLLGVYAHLDSCAGARIAQGVVNFSIDFDVDDTHVGHPLGIRVSDTTLDNDELAIFDDCMTRYFVDHVASMPSRPRPPGHRNFTIGTKVSFPIPDQDFYKFMAHPELIPR